MNIKKGNILNATENLIVHQVNDLGVMGAGLALQIKNKYPEVFKEYKKYVQIGKKPLLGSVQFTPISTVQTIVNIFSQQGISRIKRTTDYDAMEQCFKEIKEYSERNNLTVALPYNIGCGLAGGDWSTVSQLIEKYLPTAIVYKLK